jgi:hypothetical protein
VELLSVSSVGYPFVNVSSVMEIHHIFELLF